MDETERTFDSLPLDLTHNIFLRLPVESLARLILASNFFDNFITKDRDLVDSHFKQATPVDNVVVYSQKEVTPDSKGGERLSNKGVLSKFRNMKFSNPLYLGENFALAGSYNGLICFYQCSKEKRGPDEYHYHKRSNIWELPPLDQKAESAEEITNDEYCNRIYIWNPALHQIRALSNLIASGDFVAFGYDPSSQDYKILWISGGKRKKAEVYSWKNNSWKIICKNFRYVPYPEDKYIVGFEGSLHWVSGRVVSAFNIADDRLDLYRVPECVLCAYGNMLGVFKGSLSLLGTHYYSSDWSIWSLDKSGIDCSWTKKYEFHVQSPSVYNYEYSDYSDSSDEEDTIVEPKVYICGLTASGKIIVSAEGRTGYDFVDPDTIDLEKLSLQLYHPSCFYIDYVESLVSVYPPDAPHIVSCSSERDSEIAVNCVSENPYSLLTHFSMDY